MFEHVLQLGDGPRSVDQLAVLKVHQAPIKIAATLCNRAQDPVEESPTDHRSHSEKILETVIQAVDPRHDGALHRFRNLDRNTDGARTPAAPGGIEFESPALLYRTDDLFDEKWIPLRLLQNQ